MKYVSTLLLLTSAVFCAWAFMVGWSNPLLDMHSFRQTQTALSAKRMLEGGPILFYETPIMGAPWRIPFEFPVYQWTVAVAKILTGGNLDQVARGVSIFYFLLCCWPLRRLMERLEIDADWQRIFFAMFLSSPHNLFWMRTVLIESTALFCMLCYLVLGLRAIEFSQMETTCPRKAIGLGLFSAVASIIKVTTFAGASVLLGLLFLWNCWRERTYLSRSHIRGVLLTGAALWVLPFASIVSWTAITDSMKNQVPIARDYVTSHGLSHHNYGSWEQRTSSHFWFDIVGERLGNDVLGSWMWFGLFLSLGFVPRRFLGPLLGMVFLFLAPLLLFTNLHVAHVYYHSANAVFLTAAAAYLMRVLGQYSSPFWGVMLACAMVVGGWRQYLVGYYPWTKTVDQSTIAIGNHIRSHTKPNEVPFIYTYDYSSEIAYYSDRKVIMDPLFREVDDPITRETMEKSFGPGSPNVLGPVLVCYARQQDTAGVERRLLALGFAPQTKTTVGYCDIYTRPNP